MVGVSIPGSAAAGNVFGLTGQGHLIYSFVEQVRRHGADPFAYFEWDFEKLMHNPAPEELEALLPANWIKTRPAASQTIESRVA